MFCVGETEDVGVHKWEHSQGDFNAASRITPEASVLLKGAPKKLAREMARCAVRYRFFFAGSSGMMSVWPRWRMSFPPS